MYNDPILFDKSETITDQFSLHSTRSKHLVIYEQDVIKDIKGFLEYLKLRNKKHELYKIQSYSDLNEIASLCKNQKMGTQLYIASKWDNAVDIFEVAVESGFTEDEIQTKIFGETRRYVYCMKCYEISETGKEGKAQCSYCSAMMEVGPFFSKTRKGYIGYPFKFN